MNDIRRQVEASKTSVQRVIFNQFHFHNPEKQGGSKSNAQEARIGCTLVVEHQKPVKFSLIRNLHIFIFVTC